MSLEDLNKKLHGRELHLDRARPHTTYEPGVSDSADAETASQFERGEEWRKPVVDSRELIMISEEKQHRRRKMAIVIGSIAGVILLGGIVFKVRSMMFDENRIGVNVTGPKEVASAESVTYSFTYDNNNLVSLNNASVIFSYPDSFHPDESGKLKVSGSRAEMPLGTIGRYAHGKITLSGKFYGSKGELAYLHYTLRYTPSNTSATFERSGQFGVNVASSSLAFEITAPLEMATGQDVEYVVDYANMSDVSFSNLRVKMDFPEGFRFVSAEPKVSEGETVWYIGNLAGNARGKITIRGVLVGMRDERKTVSGTIGFFQGDGNFVAYNANARQTKMIASPLSIYQTVNGLTDVNVSPGDTLRYVIKYRNDGTLGLRDAIVTLELDSPYLDFSQLSIYKGAYDQARKMFVWKASDIPELTRLDPSEEGELSFTIPVKNVASLPTSEKNLSVRSRAVIDSPDVPTSIGSNKIIASDTVYAKIGALVGIDLTAFYQDTALPNTGSIPPTVGQETTYTIHLKLSNSSNDLTNARALVSLPTGIRYTGKSLLGDEIATFNERTNEMSWEVGTLTSGEKKREILFQVGVTPVANQAGKSFLLTNGVIFTAKDSFTKQDVRVERGAKESFLPEDPTVGALGAQIRPAPAL